MDWDRTAQIVERFAGAACLLAVAGSAAYFTYDSHQTELLARASLHECSRHHKEYVADTTGALPDAVKKIGEAADSLGAIAGPLSKAATSLDYSTRQLTAVMINMQRPCEVHNTRNSPFYTPFFTKDSVMPCGMLADFTKTLSTTRGAVGQFEVIGAHVNAKLPVYDQQELDLFNDVHGTFTDFNGYMRSQAMQTFTADIARTARGTADTTEQWAAISTDFKTRFHALLFPPPCLTFGCKLARTLPIIKDGLSMGESGYWVEQLIRNVPPGGN